MDKFKPMEVKKTLVRNPEQPVTKIVPTQPSTSNKSDGTTLSSSSKVSHSKTAHKITFKVPEMNSTHKMSKKIDETVRPKTIPDLNKRKLAVDEKVTRKVNFPYGKTVFKNLIPLTDNEIKLQSSTVTRDSTYQRDKEPVLSDFLQPRTQKIYYYKPKSSSDERKMNIPTANGLNLYKILHVNETFS